MRIQTKLALLMTLLAMVSTVFLVTARHSQLTRVQEIFDRAAQDSASHFNRLLDLQSASLRAFANDYTYWDEMVDFVSSGSRAWASVNLVPGLKLFDVDAVWVYRPDYSLVYSTSSLAGLDVLPVPEAALPHLFADGRFAHFFVMPAQGLMEVWGATIHPSADVSRTTPPRGYLFTGRLWDTPYVSDLESISANSIRITPYPGRGTPDTRPRRDSDRLVFSQTLRGWDGTPEARVSVTGKTDVFALSRRSMHEDLLKMGAFAALLFLLIFLSIQIWVNRPMRLISRSLETGDPGHIRRLRDNPSEFGHIAQLITRFFAQKEALAREITERETAEARLGQTEKELADARRLSDIGALAATVAHELRNPLGVIGLAVFNIRRKAGASEIERHLANIEQKVAQSERIISDLLFYSRIRMPKFEAVRICRVLADCADAVGHRFAGHEVSLRLDCAVSDDCTIEADALQMIELISNILTNAYESFPEKGGEVSVSVAAEGPDLAMVFRDSGTGIAGAELDRVFDPFFTTKSTGTGLGLSVCRQIVTLHCGAIDVASGPGKGTAITVRLPLKRKEEQQ